MTLDQLLSLPHSDLKRKLQSVARKANEDQRSLMERYKKELKSQKTKR
jgi:hypothetical protein